MTVGENRTTNMFLRILGNESLNNINDYVNDISKRDFVVLTSLEQINNLFGESYKKFLNSLSYDEINDLRVYTGYNYKNINALLRNNWNYEENGLLTEERKREFLILASKIKKILCKFETPNLNFVSFRGTTINSFSNYGISELSQLESLKGKFLYEEGFTSTSILEQTSYINKKLDDGRFCNVGIRFLIPSESDDGALLFSSDTSYSENQNEFLLNNSSLLKVIDVSIDNLNNKATLTVVLIPKKVYDYNYKQDISMSK